MSHSVFNAAWREAQASLQRLAVRDEALGQRQRETDKRAALGWVLRLYADYIRVTRTLDEVYDQLVQPQKRILIRKLLDGCIGRLLELKHELLTELDKSNFHYFDDLLIERRLTYEDLEIPSPRYYRHENEVQLRERREMIDRILGNETQQRNLSAKMAEEEKRGGPEEGDEAAPQGAPLGAPQGGAQRPSHELTRDQARPRRGMGLPPGPAGQLQEPVETPELRALRDATGLLQRHERARQDRVHTYTRRVKMMEKYRPERRRGKADIGPSEDPALTTRAAMLIQRAYRAFLARKRWRHFQEKEDLLIGLVTPRFIDYSYKTRILEVQDLRRALRRQLQAAYEAAILEERDLAERVFSPEIFDDIDDELRGWMSAWYYDVLQLPKFPAEKERKITGFLIGLPKRAPKDMFPEVDPALPGIQPRKLGGSNLITAGVWASSTEYKTVAEKMKKKKGKSGPKKPSKEEKKELKAKRREAKKAEKQRKLMEKLRGFQLEESAVMPAMKVAMREYEQEWETKRPDSENPSETHYVDLIREEQVHLKQAEVRRAVDQLMRAELELLKDAVWREKHKRRKGRKRRKKKKGKKKKKRRKGKRKKKDLTGDKTTDELLEMLVRAGVVRNSPVSIMEDFFGEPSYCNFELRQRNKDPLPALGDIRQAVREYCILPLGSAQVHLLAPLIKSVLLAGPPLCGKSLLTDIVCTETGALRMDLTPEAVFKARESFPGKKGLKMLLHVVGKVARLLQPTVIVMDNAHRNYYKKVPKPERPLKPKKFAKKLKKLTKQIKARDQVLVLGTSSEPWRARGRRLIKAYQRHILVPPMDYGSRSLMWHKLFMAYPGVQRSFEVTPLAQVTPWLPLPTMREVVERTLSVERRVQLYHKPLLHQEVLTVLLQYPAVPPVKDRKKWLKWWNRTPVQKKRAKLVAEWQKAEEGRKRRR